MSDKQFWVLISSLQGTLSDESLGRLEDLLIELDPEELDAFDETLASKLSALDRPQPELRISAPAQDFLSADSFLWLRCAVVAAGESEYLRVLSIGRIEPHAWVFDQGEDLIFITERPRKAKTGSGGYDTSVDYETGSNEQAWRYHS